MGNIIKKSITKTNQEYWLSERVAEKWKDLPLFTLREVEYMNTQSGDRIDQIYHQRKTNHNFRFLPEPEGRKTLYGQQNESFSCSHCGTSGVVGARSLDNYVSVYRCSCSWFGPEFKVSRPIKTWLEHENPTMTPRYWDVTATAQPVKVMHTNSLAGGQRLAMEAMETLKAVFVVDYSKEPSAWSDAVFDMPCIVTKMKTGHRNGDLPVFSLDEMIFLKNYTVDQVKWIYSARLDNLDIVWV